MGKHRPTKRDIDTGDSRISWLVIAEDITLGLILASTLFLFSIHLDSHFTLPKLAVFAVLLFVFSILFVLRLKSGEVQVLPKTIYIPLILLVIWWLIGTSQAMHLQTALEGQYGRYNGLYTNLLLVTLFVLSASIPFGLDRFRRFLNLFFVLLLFVCLYAFVQFLGMDPVFGAATTKRPPGSIGNPVAFAVVLLLALPLVVSELVGASMKSRLTTSIVLLVYLLILLVTGSRGPMLGLMAAFTISVILMLRFNSGIMRWFTAGKIIAALLIIMLAVAVGFYAFKDRLVPGNALEMRLTYFEVAAEMIKDSPLFGFGFESFRVAYPAYRPFHDALFYENTVITPTMIHNDYLQLAADNGVLSLVFYLAFILGLIRLYLNAIKTNDKSRHYFMGIVVMLTAWLAQGMTGWLEAASSIVFWLLLGVATSFSLNSMNTERGISKKVSGYYAVIAGVFLCVTGFTGYVYANKVFQDYTLREATYYSRSNHSYVDEKLEVLGRSAADDSAYMDRIGLLYAKRLQDSPARNTYQLARKYFLRARELNTFDPYVRFHIIQTDATAIKHRLIDRPSQEASQDMDEIVRLDPNNPTTYQVRATLHMATGNHAAARKNIELMNRILNQ